MKLIARNVIISNSDREDFMRNEYTLTLKGVRWETIEAILSLGKEVSDRAENLFKKYDPTEEESVR